MMDKTDKINELFKTESFSVAFFENLEDTAFVKSLFEENGVSLTDEEIAQTIAVARTAESSSDGELSEDALSDAAGGIIGWVIAGTASAIFFGYQVYKARKGINSALGYCK